MVRAARWLALVLSLLASSAAFAASPVEIGSRVEPFVDEFLLEKLEGTARLVVQQPEPKELVFTADRPWEGNTSAYYTIFEDNGRYRMYYRGAHYDEATKKATHLEVTCYAESADGIHWTRPELGLFAFQGSKRNNIIWQGPGAHNLTPFKDANPACPPEARYKALALVKGGLAALRSRDGIHWVKMAESPVITRGVFDSQNLAFWDSHAGLYREYHRALRNKVRDIMTGTSHDFLRWTDPEFLEYKGTADEHLYTNAILPYSRAPHILIGFPTRFLPAHEQTEPTFMASRDGRTFRRYADAVIPTTAPADRDGNRSNYMAWGLVQLPGHERELSVFAKEAYYTGPGSRIRRFAYRLDGFVALRAEKPAGEAVTRPVRFAGESLVLNYRTRPGGSVRVELSAEDGTPIRGFAAADARALQGDDTAAPVAWSGGSDVAALAGRPIRLRFLIQDADLFSFRFE